MGKTSDISTAIASLGGATATARFLGVNSYQTVQQWEKTGVVPAKYCPRLERATGIPRSGFRPGDWSDIWDEWIPVHASVSKPALPGPTPAFPSAESES